MTTRTSHQRQLFVASLVIFSLIAFTTNLWVSTRIFQGLGNQSEVSNALQRFRRETRRQLGNNDNATNRITSNSNAMDDTNNNVPPYTMNDGSIPEEPIDNPPLASGNDTFSACLLVMDDNHRLVEWLAYHYHVLPLRYLIVAVDTRSRTSPTAILNRYRNMGMYIEEWTDVDFLHEKLAKNVIADDARFQVKRDRHRARQKVFYRTCLVHMQEAKREYVTLHDTDEYLVYNHAGGKNYESWEAQMQARHDTSKNNDKKRIKPSQTPPTTAEEGSLLKYIQQEKTSGLDYYQSPCISVPRLHFGAVESSPQEQANHVPSGFDPEQFDTMRWRKHSKRDNFVKNNLAKVIFDVSRVNFTSVRRFQSLHRPMPKICKAPWNNDWEVGLRINHYLGTWESYSFRDDSRRGGERSRETWEFQAADEDDTDDNIRPWLEGFVNQHGARKTKSLLQGVGLPKDYKNTNNTAWKFQWIDRILERNETEGTNPKNHEFDEFIRSRYENPNVSPTQRR